MKYIFPALSIAILILLFSFRPKGSSKNVNADIIMTNESVSERSFAEGESKTDELKEQAAAFVEYAKTLLGTRYVYGSANPNRGLDCSGFVNCVSTHFGIKVPRSSVAFTNLGTSIGTNDAKAGDLILFTGSNVHKRVVGHMGIVTDNQNGQIQFIHSSSGKTKAVRISDLNGYYATRLVKIIRIFPLTADKVIV